MKTPLLSRPGATRVIAPVALGIFFLLLWEGFCTSMRVPVYLVPKPSDVLATLWTDGPDLFQALGMTLKITLLAFLTAVVFGVLTAFLLVQSKIIEASLLPYAILLQV